MIRAVTLCVGDWVWHIPTQKPIQISREILAVAGQHVIGYDFNPIMLEEKFFIENGFAPIEDSLGKGYQLMLREKNEISFIDWRVQPATEESPERVYVKINGNGCFVSFDRNIAIHELQAAMRICKISKPLIV